LRPRDGGLRLLFAGRLRRILRLRLSRPPREGSGDEEFAQAVERVDERGAPLPLKPRG
jgi:hypothetical protein